MYGNNYEFLSHICERPRQQHTAPTPAMSREAVELQLVNYYAREGYYYHLQVTREQRRRGKTGG